MRGWGAETAKKKYFNVRNTGLHERNFNRLQNVYVWSKKHLNIVLHWKGLD